MATSINLVTGDTLPTLTLTITDATTRTVVDLSDDDIEVKLHFRLKGDDTIIASLDCFPVTDGSDGKVLLYFGNLLTTIEAGKYEGEVEIKLGTQTQTVYDPIQFTVREQFA